jgi:Uncharacterized protein conserved in bacteria
MKHIVFFIENINKQVMLRLYSRRVFYNKNNLLNCVIHLQDSNRNNKKNDYITKRSYYSGGFDISQYVNSSSLTVAAATVTTALATYWVSTLYKVALPNEYLVKTGLFIDDISISKKCFQLPFQTLSPIDMTPLTIHCVIEDAMSSERISFKMPTVFTVGPANNVESLKNYARLLQGTTKEDLKTKIMGIIRGEARMAAGKLPLDDLFNNKENFKHHVSDKINTVLADFGLYVYNANLEDFKDLEGNEYFLYLKKRALEGAVNSAKVAVAEQNKIGNIGERKHLTETRQGLAEYEKQAKLTENERDKDIAESDTQLKIAKAEFEKLTSIANFESQAASEKRQLELQREVEEFRNKQNVEKLRASELSVASVQAETKIKDAEGYAQSVQLKAAGDASAIKLKAEAEAEAIKLKALAQYIEVENQAKGILELRKAEAKGLSDLISAAGSIESLSHYLMVRDNVPVNIAVEQAKGLQNLKPSINYWFTGNKNSNDNVSTTIQDIAQTTLPLLDSVKKQYGIDFLKGFKTD